MAKVRLIIHILDIDQSQKTVDLKIIVCISNFPYNESRVGVWVIGAGDTIIWCNNTGAHMVSTWYYQGESEQTTWLLEGMGEHFPFDSYNLRFEVYDVYFINHNFTLSSEGHQAFFTGSKAYSLKDLWKTDNGLIPIEYIKTEEIAFAIGRSDNALSIAILQFLIPIIGCYYLLGATLMLNPKEKLAERLRIHLSLFVFVPTFLIAIQKFLPYRSSLSFPEFLLVNLIVSNTLFGIFSIFGNQKNSRKQKVTYSRWDLIASNLSLVLFMIIYLFTLFGRINIPASLIFTYIVVPSYICFYFAVMSKEQIKKQILGIAVFIILALIPLIFILISTL
ncbi:hypothetical protein KAU88_07545 [Candidatus Bathyarchaeota archaeon]|nr:hypothetical protein [Candidatus Bathyarchaeota archaeon]